MWNEFWSELLDFKWLSSSWFIVYLASLNKAFVSLSHKMDHLEIASLFSSLCSWLSVSSCLYIYYFLLNILGRLKIFLDSFDFVFRADHYQFISLMTLPNLATWMGSYSSLSFLSPFSTLLFTCSEITVKLSKLYFCFYIRSFLHHEFCLYFECCTR